MTEVRAARIDDLDAVLAIYGHETQHGFATFETEPPAADVWAAKLTGELPFLVATIEDRVVGIAYASTFRPRPAYHRTVETSVYLAADARGQGIGTLLYDALLPLLTARGMHIALALIALPNEASERLHLAHGFVRGGTMQEVGDKFDQLIDVALYQRFL